MSNAADLDRLFARFKREKGKLEIAFANAGVAKFAPFGTISDDSSYIAATELFVDDSEDSLAFSVLENIRPMIETAPLEKAAEAYACMMDGKARFRMVLVTEQ
ncbi:MAG TPA: hypothetical protein VGY55_17820 [Pirellulales bacterium]|nr:hypothetical protein [Pirellulales bacterium]